MKKRYLVLMCGLAVCLAVSLPASALLAPIAYTPAIDHIHYGEDVFNDVFNMGFGNVTERALIGTYADPPKMLVVAAAGHTIDQVITAPGAGAMHTGKPIETADGGFVLPVVTTNTIARFQSDGTFINSWTTTGYPTAMAEDDSGNIWVGMHNGFPACKLVQYDTAGNILQEVLNAAGLPQRATIDFVGGMHMYDGLMYVADGGRMIKFDPADPAGTMAEAIAGTDYWGGNFWEVQGMDIGPDGRIYVVENVNRTVRIYDAAADPTANLIQVLTDVEMDQQPSGVGVDSAGTIYVGENGAWPNIMKFDIVPEPTTMILLGLGSLALLRRKRS